MSDDSGITSATPNRPSNTAIYSAVVSTLAFGVAAFNIYFTQLLPAKLSANFGYAFDASYGFADKGQINAPVIMRNSGARPGEIRQLRLILTDLTSNAQYTLYPDRYLKHEGSVFTYTDSASPEFLSGNQLIQREIEFITPPGWRQKNGWHAGRYRLELTGMRDQAKPVTLDTATFEIDQDDMVQISRGDSNSRTVFSDQSGVTEKVFRSNGPPAVSSKTPAPNANPAQPG